jgi:hypothetical protein
MTKKWLIMIYFVKLPLLIFAAKFWVNLALNLLLKLLNPIKITHKASSKQFSSKIITKKFCHLKNTL